jgi:hypothetical protein
MGPHPNVTFGAGFGGSSMSPIAMVAMVTAIVLVCALPRKWAIAPFLVFVFLIPYDQQYNVGGVHLFAHRIVILCGCLRFLPKAFSTPTALAGGFTAIDKVFLLWALCRAAAFVLLYHEGAAVVNQVGFLWDTLGGYFLIRCLIRGVEDIRRVAGIFVVISTIMACCMLYEHYRDANVFALLMGGKVAPNIRAGKIRCHGVFAQEIIASAFGGTLVPFFLWFWTTAKGKLPAAIGLISSATITIMASSSTGISAAVFGVGALCVWPLRNYVRWMLWGLVVVILGFAVSMKAPVWFLLARVDFVGGSTGWDRANLIDQCIRHFSSWWLVGTADNDTWGFSTWDLCNQFVAEAVQGGLTTLLLFLVLIKRSFNRIGVARSKAHSRSHAFLLWSIGCILCAHLASFLGISYFDQIKYWWYLTLAMIPAAAAFTVPASTKESPQKASASEADRSVADDEAPIAEPIAWHSATITSLKTAS